MLIRVSPRCKRPKTDICERYLCSYDRICTFNAPVSLPSLSLDGEWQGYIKSINPVVRKQKCMQKVPIMMRATQFNPNQPNQCFTASPVRARERQIRATKKGILGVLCRAPNEIVLPLIRTTHTLQVQILSCDVLCH